MAILESDPSLVLRAQVRGAVCGERAWAHNNGSSPGGRTPTRAPSSPRTRLQEMDQPFEPVYQAADGTWVVPGANK